jgi:hypothetical protein
MTGLTAFNSGTLVSVRNMNKFYKRIIRICKLKDRQHNGQKDNQRSTKSPNILSVLGWSPTIKEHKNHYHVHSQINLNNYDIIGVIVSSPVIIKWFVFLELLY